MGPLVGLQLASPPSRCAGFGTRASLRSPCSCLFWQLEGIALLLPRAPGSCARAARSRTPPAHKDCSLWQKQRLAAWAWTVSLCQMLWAGARECPGFPAKPCTEPFPRTALLSARVGVFLHSAFHTGMDCKQLQMSHCSAPPLVFMPGLKA